LKAADQGHEQAQLFLGILYITGELNGGEPCFEKAEHFLKASASSGLGLAQFILGVFVLRGWSPSAEMVMQSKDTKRIQALKNQAIKLIESAATKNHKNAMLWLKALYDQEKFEEKQKTAVDKFPESKPAENR
jgi:TPR repeat protein